MQHHDIYILIYYIQKLDMKNTDKELINLIKSYPNIYDLGYKVRNKFTHITINNKRYYINRDFPNNGDLGKFLSIYNG
jgi:hypothetical protein